MTPELVAAFVAAVASMEARGHVVELRGRRVRRGWVLTLRCTRCGAACGYDRERWSSVVGVCA